jgi:hypothetical protein
MFSFSRVFQADGQTDINNVIFPNFENASKTDSTSERSNRKKTKVVFFSFVTAA